MKNNTFNTSVETQSKKDCQCEAERNKQIAVLREAEVREHEHGDALQDKKGEHMAAKKAKQRVIEAHTAHHEHDAGHERRRPKLIKDEAPAPQKTQPAERAGAKAERNQRPGQRGENRAFQPRQAQAEPHAQREQQKRVVPPGVFPGEFQRENEADGKRRGQRRAEDQTLPCEQKRDKHAHIQRKDHKQIPVAVADALPEREREQHAAQRVVLSDAEIRREKKQHGQLGLHEHLQNPTARERAQIRAAPVADAAKHAVAGKEQKRRDDELVKLRFHEQIGGVESPR